jgi:FAD/FMN-containing dehydrogenase
MKRRAFCASAVAAVAAASIPLRRAFAVDVAALGPGGKQVVLQSTAIDDLRASMRGELLVPGQEGYDAARKVWNGAFDRRPALIARCAGAADVVQSVKFGHAHDLVVAVRGGGHSLSGQSVCEGGLMIDLSPMKSVHVDPLARTARVEPGVLLGQFDREAQAFGLATTAGTVSHTGAAGLTLGGGFGRIGRKYALACDNMRAADIVTADGKFVKASETENADLLWGLRGGGGNFGVVTSFEYRLHQVGPIMFGGPLLYPFDQAREVLRFYSDFIAAAPDELYVDAAIVPTPDGKRAVFFDVCYCGSIEAGQRVLAPLREFRKPLVDRLRPTPYVELQRSGDDANPIGRSYYIKSGFMKRIEPAMIDVVVDRLSGTAPMTALVVFALAGGAIGRVKPGATAFLHREANHSLVIMGFWDNPAGAASSTQWARETWRATEPMTEGFYVNEVSNDDPERRIRANYGANYDRLVKLKNRYDRTNLFRMNANVKPSV